MTLLQKTLGPQAALLRNNSGIDTPVKNSLCCEAVGITALPHQATAEALIPHEKLRGAAIPEATLNAHIRPLAQPVLGYMQFSRGSNATLMIKAGRRMSV